MSRTTLHVAPGGCDPMYSEIIGIHHKGVICRAEQVLKKPHKGMLLLSI